MNKTHTGKSPARARMARATALAVFTGAWTLTSSPAEDLGGDLMGRLPAEMTGRVAGWLATGETTAGLAPGTFARPMFGALAGRGREGVPGNAPFPDSLQALPMPSAFSVVLWVRIDSGQPATPLFGLGEPEGDYLFAATDSTGAATLALLSRNKVTHFDRAKLGAANLADGRLHALVAVINLHSGLVRLYVDGKPETASASTLWRPRELGAAFAVYALQGRTDASGSDAPGLLMPRLIPRELSEAEIAQLTPEGGESETAVIDQELAARLIRDTLMEFWPAQFSYQLRRRPL